MKTRKNMAAVALAIVVSAAAVPAYSSSEIGEPDSWYSWFLSLFVASEDRSNASGSGLGQPPPR